MGLESHIVASLAREKSGFVAGEDFRFEFGLRTDNERIAQEIAIILDETGEFGATRIIKERLYYSERDSWKIDFGTHPQFLRA